RCAVPFTRKGASPGANGSAASSAAPSLFQATFDAMGGCHTGARRRAGPCSARAARLNASSACGHGGASVARCPSERPRRLLIHLGSAIEDERGGRSHAPPSGGSMVKLVQITLVFGLSLGPSAEALAQSSL